MNQEVEVPLLPYYVYCLIDPRKDKKNEIFYVGKGKGERGYHHLMQVEDLLSTSPKLERMREIIKESEIPQCIVIGRYNTEGESLAVESTLIKWCYGFNNLTNQILGHNQINIRMKDDFSINGGLDIPKRINLNDGAFTDNEVFLNEKLEIEQKLNSLLIFLQPHIDLDEERIHISMKPPKDPSLFVEMDSCRIQLLLRNTSNDHAVFNVKIKHGLEKEFNELIISNEAEIKGTGNSRYFKIPNEKSKISIYDTESVLKRILNMIKACS